MGKRTPSERQKIERRRGKPLTNQQWSMLATLGLVEDPAGAADVEGVVEILVGLADESSSRAMPSALAAEVRLDNREGRRGWAASLLEWREARQRPSVVAYRREVLGGSLVAHGEGGAWVGARAELEGEPARLYLCRLRQPPALADDNGYVGAVPFSGGGHVIEVQPRQLRFVARNGDWRYETAVTVSPGGALDELRVIAEAMASEHRWHPAAAADFVLTDSVPLRPSVTASVTVGVGGGVVHLGADLRADPAAVARAFRRARAKWLGPTTRGLSDDGYALAAFVAARPGLSWVALHRRWRQERPEGGHADRRAFTAAAKRALVNVGGDPSQLVGTGGEP